jgi:predicted cupin superfamily sugar epimerase
MVVQQIIDILQLQPLPREGGLVAPTYVSSFLSDGQPAGTAIFYLLTGDAFSHLHRLAGDEMYHFYLGDPVELLELLPDGTWHQTLLGADLMSGQHLQHLVPAGNWQGSRLATTTGFALLGTTMWPGYRDSEYEHGERAALIRQYPAAADAIRQLTETPPSASHPNM